MMRSSSSDAVPQMSDTMPKIASPTTMTKRRPKMSASAAAKVNVVNVDYYAATTYTFLGIPADLGTSIFALGRIAGWSAHIMEQHGDNRLIRPESEYTGPSGKRYIPIAER